MVEINVQMSISESKITFYEPDYYPEEGLTYSVLAARFRGKWIFVRHHGSDGWEMPAGHIEEGETSEEAAIRELSEETGAEEFEICCVATYSVEKDGVAGYGRLFFAEVEKMGSYRDNGEIEEIMLSASMPGELTYPDIQPVLFSRVFRYIQKLPS